MKCSSQRNCNLDKEVTLGHAPNASMKCSSQRNCNPTSGEAGDATPGLNEVQFPKELQRVVDSVGDGRPYASMKCSSQRNCNTYNEFEDYTKYLPQ